MPAAKSTSSALMMPKMPDHQKTCAVCHWSPQNSGCGRPQTDHATTISLNEIDSVPHCQPVIHEYRGSGQRAAG
jgi:hypothetical protein